MYYACLSVSLLTLCTCIGVILALQITNVRCRYFVRINVFILSGHCCHVGHSTSVGLPTGNRLSRQRLGSAVDMGTAITTAKHR